MSQTKAQLVEGLNINTSAPADSLVIDSSGKVGVGTNSPQTLLHLSALNSGGGAANVIRITDEDTAVVGDQICGRIEFETADTGNPGVNCQIDALYSGSGGGSKLQFRTGFAGVLVDALHISDTGAVGIGTTSPSGIVNLDRPDLSTDTWLRVSQAGTEVFSLSQPSSSEIRFATPDLSVDREFTFYTKGLERVRIDSSGRLLVGTSSDITGGTNYLIQSISSTGAFIALGRDDGSVANGDGIGGIQFYGNDGGSYEGAAFIGAFADGTHSAGSKPSRLVFSTTDAGDPSPTERLRIGADGTISTTAGSTPGASTFGTALGRASNPGLLESYRDGTANTSVCNFGGPLGNVLIKCDGDLENTNNRYTGISDIKLKENIVDATSQWADIKSLRVRNYNFKAETGFSTHTQIGLVAQEVELVSPGLVGETLNEDTGELTKNVAYSVLYMKAVKALQEAMERIEQLETEMAEVKAQLQTS